MSNKQKNSWLKMRYKDEVFTKLCEKDMERCGRPRHHINSSYSALDWVADNFDLIPKDVILPQKNEN